MESKLIGREREIDTIMSCLKRKQNILVTGQTGVGKTALLKYIAVLPELEGRVYTIDELARSRLIEAYMTLGGTSDSNVEKPKLTQWTMRQIAKALITLAENRDDFVLIIELDKITAANASWLIDIAESNITVLGACSQPRKTGKLSRFFWSFETLELKPMSDAEIKEIIRAAVYPSDSSEPAITFREKKTQRYFVERVIKIAQGVPLAAVEMCKRAAGNGTVSMTFVKEHLIDHKAGTRWIDASPILLIGACVLFFLRYASRTMNNVDAYIFFSSLSTIAFIVVRSFVRGRDQKSS